MGYIAGNCRTKAVENKNPIKRRKVSKKWKFGKRYPGLDKGKSGSRGATSPSKVENMRTIMYGPESNPEGIISMSMKGPVLGKDVKEQFMSLLVKDFT